MRDAVGLRFRATGVARLEQRPRVRDAVGLRFRATGVARLEQRPRVRDAVGLRDRRCTSGTPSRACDAVGCASAGVAHPGRVPARVVSKGAESDIESRKDSLQAHDATTGAFDSLSSIPDVRRRSRGSATWMGSRSSGVGCLDAYFAASGHRQRFSCLSFPVSPFDHFRNVRRRIGWERILTIARHRLPKRSDQGASSPRRSYGRTMESFSKTNALEPVSLVNYQFSYP